MKCEYHHASKTMFIDDCMKTLRKKEHTMIKRNDTTATTAAAVDNDESIIYNNLIHTANMQIYYLKRLLTMVYTKRNERVIEELIKQRNEIENEIELINKQYITITEHNVICERYNIEHKQKMIDILNKLITLKYKLNECDTGNTLQSVQSTIDNNYSVLCNTNNTIYFSES